MFPASLINAQRCPAWPSSLGYKDRLLPESTSSNPEVLSGPPGSAGNFGGHWIIRLSFSFPFPPKNIFLHYNTGIHLLSKKKNAGCGAEKRDQPIESGQILKIDASGLNNQQKKIGNKSLSAAFEPFENLS